MKRKPKAYEPVQSLNTKVDLVMEGTSFMKMNCYGKIMIGDRGFEFYDDRNVHDYIQIPWDEVTYVVCGVVFGGRWIPRFSVRTARKPKVLLRAVREHIPADHIVRSLTFTQRIVRDVKSIMQQHRE